MKIKNVRILCCGVPVETVLPSQYYSAAAACNSPEDHPHIAWEIEAVMSVILPQLVAFGRCCEDAEK